MKPFRRPSRSRRAKPLRFQSPALLARAERELAAALAPPEPQATQHVAVHAVAGDLVVLRVVAQGEMNPA